MPHELPSAERASSPAPPVTLQLHTAVIFRPPQRGMARRQCTYPCLSREHSGRRIPLFRFRGRLGYAWRSRPAVPTRAEPRLALATSSELQPGLPLHLFSSDQFGVPAPTGNGSRALSPDIFE